MKRFTVVYILFLCTTAAHGAPKIYLKNLQAYTLGYSQTEFYEAFLVTDRHTSNPTDLIQQVRGLCHEFPMIDQYVIRIFNDEKIADPYTFKSTFGSGIGGNLKKISATAMNSYIAEINSSGELISFPFNPDKKNVINIGHNWCKQKL